MVRTISIPAASGTAGLSEPVKQAVSGKAKLLNSRRVREVQYPNQGKVHTQRPQVLGFKAKMAFHF
jgi:hypothetical protein